MPAEHLSHAKLEASSQCFTVSQLWSRLMRFTSDPIVKCLPTLAQLKSHQCFMSHKLSQGSQRLLMVKCKSLRKGNILMSWHLSTLRCSLALVETSNFDGGLKASTVAVISTMRGHHSSFEGCMSEVSSMSSILIGLSTINHPFWGTRIYWTSGLEPISHLQGLHVSTQLSRMQCTEQRHKHCKATKH